MYNLIIEKSNNDKVLLYSIDAYPHLWVLALNGKNIGTVDNFIDGLIKIAANSNETIFADEVANFIVILDEYRGYKVLVGGNQFTPSQAKLNKSIEEFDFDNIFGQYKKIEVADRQPVDTQTRDEYFKQYQTKYKSQYRSVTNILVGINVAIFIFNIIISYLPFQYIIGGSSLLSIWTYISILGAGFTHLSFFHVFFNMSFLMSVGPSLEKILGFKKFLALYFLSMFISGITVALFSHGLTAGASGALYGLFTYFICLVVKHGTNRAQLNNVLITFGLNIIFTLSMPGISIAGHLGGILAGLIFFAINDSKSNNLFRK